MNCQFCGDEAGLNSFCADCMEGQLLSEAAGSVVTFGVSEVREWLRDELEDADSFGDAPDDMYPNRTATEKETEEVMAAGERYSDGGRNDPVHATGWAEDDDFDDDDPAEGFISDNLFSPPVVTTFDIPVTPTLYPPEEQL